MTIADLAASTTVKIIFIALLCAAFFGAAWNWRGAIESENQLATLRNTMEVSGKANKVTAQIARDYQKLRAKHEANGKLTQGIIQNEIDQNPVYRNCVLSPSVVRAINQLSGYSDR